MPRASIALLLVQTPLSVHALEWSGYYKNRALRSETLVGPPVDYWQDLNRLRLDLSQSLQPVSVNLVYDVALITGDYLATPQFRQQVEAPDARYWTLQGQWLDRGYAFATHGLYRATLDYRSGFGDIRIGRQQINWATAVIWNPIDRFNPLNPLQLERDERLGVDAVLLDYNPDELARLSLAYAPQHRAAQDSAALRYQSHLGHYDAALMLGTFADVQKAGVSLAGQIGLIGLRSEVVCSDPAGGRAYVEGVLSLDYTTAGGTSLLLEGYFNGEGEADPRHYDFRQLLNAKKLGLARHYLGARVGRELNALLTVELYLIRNLDDGSHFFYPSLSYTLPGFEDLYLRLGAQLFEGDPGDEYGFLRNIYAAEMNVYF